MVDVGACDFENATPLSATRWETLKDQMPSPSIAPGSPDWIKIKKTGRTGGDQADQGVKTRVPSSRMLWCLAAGEGNLMRIGQTNRCEFIAALASATRGL